ncbi:unnamed protein product [Spodoptera littoralis]|uniref:Uncharacterized protein n=1 Tax=Spodoptera littoralis TaxID=7109 RepID=A0A9P0IA03_SPOLI|nr:unnamed protein product [Spodoptera littoralis]CAH1642145.1 unnamed protein product [Spodoptera littoralis]
MEAFWSQFLPTFGSRETIRRSSEGKPSPRNRGLRFRCSQGIWTPESRSRGPVQREPRSS